MSAKTQIRNWVAAGCRATGVIAWARKRAREALTIVCYHRVLPQPERSSLPFPQLAVTPQEFASHLKYYALHYACLPLQDAVESLRSGVEPRRPRLVITFDDGYCDNFHHARPILNAHGIRATFFVISSLVGSSEPPWYDQLGRAVLHLEAAGARLSLRETLQAFGAEFHHGTGIGASETVGWAKSLVPRARTALVGRITELAAANGWRRDAIDRIMTRDQVRTLASEGHEVGSHTCSHPILTQLSREEVKSELVGSLQDLSGMIERPVASLAYPNGDFDEGVMAAAGQAGYRFAVTTRPGRNSRHTDSLRLRRLFVSQDRLARPDGTCSADLMGLELTGAADAVFLRRRRESR